MTQGSNAPLPHGRCLTAPTDTLNGAHFYLNYCISDNHQRFTIYKAPGPSG
jgi:hypothetical protein